MAFLCFLNVQHSSSGAANAVIGFAVVDTPRRVLLIHDVGQSRQLARMSHHPVDRVSSLQFACMLCNCMCKIAISVGATSLAHRSAH